MKKRISVITVCYNSARTISVAFESVLKQTILPYEYIVIDGGSSDETLSIIKKYQKKFEQKDVRFIVVSESDKGIYDAMNKGLKLVTGEWIHYLNSDDCYCDYKVFENILSEIQDCYDFVYANLMVVCADGSMKRCKPSVLPRKFVMYFTCPINQPATFFKSSVLKKYEFDITYKNSADYKLWVELLKCNKRNKYVDLDITKFGIGGASANLKNLYIENRRVLIESRLYLGFCIQTCYLHLLILTFLKNSFPSFHKYLKKMLIRK